MPTDRADEPAILRQRPAALPPRHRWFDPASALLMGALAVCMMTAFALYAGSH